MVLFELMATGSSDQGSADRLVITLPAMERYVSTTAQDPRYTRKPPPDRDVSWLP
jgi:hypothetical protein